MTHNGCGFALVAGFQRRMFQTADKDKKYFNVLATFSARH
jgi:hypothetical protein